MIISYVKYSIFFIGMLSFLACSTDDTDEEECICSLEEEITRTTGGERLNGTKIKNSIEAAFNIKGIDFTLDNDIETTFNKTKELVYERKAEVDSIASAYNVAIKPICALERICRCQDNGKLSKDSILSSCNAWLNSLLTISEYLLSNLENKVVQAPLPSTTTNLDKVDINSEEEEQPHIKVINTENTRIDNSRAQVPIDDPSIQTQDSSSIEKELIEKEVFTVRIIHNSEMKNCTVLVDEQEVSPLLQTQNFTDIGLEAGKHKIILFNDRKRCEGQLNIVQDTLNITLPCHNANI